MDAIVLSGVRTHNLKNFDLTLPHKRLYVITGVSGSGKSSLAFDTLYAEGQRRYVESLSSYARQFLERMEKPDVDSVAGIPPALAIEAKNVISNARSTVGTQTEINDYLRLLFARVGRTVCPDCGREVVPSQPDSVADLLIREFPGRELRVLFQVPLGEKGKRYLKESLAELERQGFADFFSDGRVVPASGLMQGKVPGDGITVCADRITAEARNRRRLAESLELAFRYGRNEARVFAPGKMLRFSENLRCFSCGRVFREPVPNLFSFNSPLGACTACQGFGRVITIDWDLVIPDASRSISGGAIEPWTKPGAQWEFRQLLKFCKAEGISVSRPWKELPAGQREAVLKGRGARNYFSVADFFEYLGKKTYKMHVRIFLSKYRGFTPCPACGLTRLKPEALWVRVCGKNIWELQSDSIDRVHDFFAGLALPDSENERALPVLFEIRKRVRFLKEVGLGYLSLSRLSRTLSGGEVQRIHLAASLGSALVDTLYVLDEPSIGLHERDNDLLIRLLKELRDLGNTVVVVEHDRAMIESADEVIDLGPEGGEHGGEIIFQGSVADIRRSERSLTGRYLAGKTVLARKSRPVPSAGAPFIRIRGAVQHNLKAVDVDIPLGRLTVLAGVSGSGKSTLLYDILYRHYLRFRGRPVQDIGIADRITGFEHVGEMALIDQSPIGRTPRSNPATYLGAFDDIRKLFSKTPSARREGLGPGHFSFNVDGGRCPSCKGDGRVKVEMHFLADVFIPCEACQGKRFKPEVLEVEYEGKNIDEVLAMTIDEAVDFFSGEETLVGKLNLLRKVGLGYLGLGQSALTLSGGEAQRMKLAFEMAERQDTPTLYLFDEPTTGLHYHDIHYLLEAFEGLLERGHSILVIEHNMEIIRLADWIIDLGPEGGEAGGRVLFSGPVRDFIGSSNSHTAKYLKQFIAHDENRLPSTV